VALSAGNVLQDVACQGYSLFIVIHCHICPPGVVLAKVPEPSVPKRNLNFVWANSHRLERKNYIRIWAKCRPDLRLR
jgi:hypothetical protein